MVNITRYHSKLYVRKLSFLSFCRFAETDKNDNSDKTDIGHVFAGGSATILATCSDLADFPRAILLQFPIRTMILLCDYYDITMWFRVLPYTFCWQGLPDESPIIPFSISMCENCDFCEKCAKVILNKYYQIRTFWKIVYFAISILSLSKFSFQFSIFSFLFLEWILHPPHP